MEWLALRRDGQSCAYIADRAGVRTADVRRATDPYGPFPRPTQWKGRRLDPEPTARDLEWVALRRRGVRATAIAAANGVCHQYVSRRTRGYGPYPSPDVIEEWTRARRAQRTIRQIAEDWEVEPAVIRSATAEHGPFPKPGAQMPSALVGQAEISRRLKVSPLTVRRWVREGLVPSADFETRTGRKVWLRPTIEAWFAQASELLETCPDCGARTTSTDRHRGGAHR